MGESKILIQRANKEVEHHISIKNIIVNTVYFCVLISLIVITIRISYQTFFFPDKIPDIFGIKLFIIFDEQQMDDSIKHGDLVITKNIETNTLEIGDVIAFRNGSNTVTLNKIANIEKEKQIDKENNDIQIFTMETLDAEIAYANTVREEKVEGVLIHKIAKLGSILYFIGQPLPMIGISCAIVFIGLIFYYIAYRLDEKDEKIIDQTKQI